MGFDPGSPGSRPGPKAGAKPLRHPGIPHLYSSKCLKAFDMCLDGFGGIHAKVGEIREQDLKARNRSLDGYK